MVVQHTLTKLIVSGFSIIEYLLKNPFLDLIIYTPVTLLVNYILSLTKLSDFCTLSQAKLPVNQTLHSGTYPYC